VDHIDWRLASLIALGAILVTVVLIRRSVKADIEWPSGVSDQTKALTSLEMLEQADDVRPKVRRALILQLIEQGLLPGITADYAEPEKYVELMHIVENRAYPDGLPGTTNS